MRRIGLIVGVLVAVVLLGSASRAQEAAGQLQGRLTVSGAWALYPMVVRWAEEFRKVQPGVIIDVSAGGAGKGMTDALSQTVDLGMVSRDINPVEIEKGAWWVSVVKDAVLPTMNADHPQAARIARRGLTREEFAGIWVTGAVADWGALTGSGSEGIHVYTRSDACGAAETWARYLGVKQEDLEGTAVYGDPGLAEAVRKDPLGIGYNNVGFAFDPSTRRPVQGLQIIPIDLDGNRQVDSNECFYATLTDVTRAIADGRYPSPPARDLHLVSKGAPEKPLVREFLRWILTDGQRYVEEAGFILLDAARIEVERGKLAGAP
jgi:phosphate transport system substrate-binding protein